jgi:hypothetical protein
MVKYPICVNPTNELIKKVMENNHTKDRVKVIVERKDVVYSLTAEDIHIF